MVKIVLVFMLTLNATVKAAQVTVTDVCVFSAGHGGHGSVLHHDGPQEVYRVQFQGCGVQQTRPRRLH